MRRLWNVGLVAGLVAATSGVAATAASATTATATSTTPIVVGGDGDSLSPGNGTAEGFEAGIYRFNKAGGLDGRKIKFSGFLDDNFSGQTTLTNAQQLVENEHVMAVVPFSSEVASGATGTYLAQAKVPFIGWNVDAAFTAAPTWGYGINGNQVNTNAQGLPNNQLLLAMTGHTLKSGKVKAAFIAENIAAAISANNALASAGQAVGEDIVYKQAPVAVLGTTSYAPYAQALIASGANFVFETLDNADSIGLAAALRAAGYKGPIINGVTYLPGQLASQPNDAAALKGVYVQDEFPADENNTPAVKQAEKDLTAIGQPPDLTSGVSVGYWSAIVFEQMLEATLKAVGGNPNNVTSAAIQKTVNGGFTYTDPIAGGIGTEYFPAAETVPTGCGSLLRVVGTGYKQILPYGCAAVFPALKKLVNEKTGKPGASIP